MTRVLTEAGFTEEYDYLVPRDKSWLIIAHENLSEEVTHRACPRRRSEYTDPRYAANHAGAVIYAMTLRQGGQETQRL